MVFIEVEGNKINNLTKIYKNATVTLFAYFSDVKNSNFIQYDFVIMNSETLIEPDKKDFLSGGFILNPSEMNGIELNWYTIDSASRRKNKANINFNQIEPRVFRYITNQNVPRDFSQNYYFILEILEPGDNSEELKLNDFTSSFKKCCLESNNINCVIDFQTKASMDKCLNWRRVDNIGDKCRQILSDDEKENSIISFCQKNLYAQDCKCVNRELYDEYKESKSNGHPYCWYSNCQSNNYLVPKIDSVKCPDNKTCKVILNSDNVRGNVSTSNNVILCNDDEKAYKPPTTKEEDDNTMKIIIFLIVGVILIVLFTTKSN